MTLPGHMSAEQRDALRDAVGFVSERYDPWGIVAAGTIIRGNPDPHSDLDLYVVHDAPFRQRVQRRFNGVPVEIFVNPETSVREYFEREARRGRPSTAHMIATGIVILGDHDPRLLELRRLALESLEAGPQWSQPDLTRARYGAATLVEDALDRRDADPETAIRILSVAVDATVSYWFKSRGSFIPRPKDLLGEIEKMDRELGRLCRRFWGDHSAAERWAAALAVADRTISTRHFFEWESDEEPVASSV